MLVEKEFSPFVEHVDAALKWALYSNAVFHFINVRLTEGLIKTLGRRRGAGSPIWTDIIMPDVAIGLRIATRFASTMREKHIIHYYNYIYQCQPSLQIMLVCCVLARYSQDNFEYYHSASCMTNVYFTKMEFGIQLAN